MRILCKSRKSSAKFVMSHSWAVIINSQGCLDILIQHTSSVLSQITKGIIENDSTSTNNFLTLCELFFQAAKTSPERLGYVNANNSEVIQSFTWECPCNVSHPRPFTRKPDLMFPLTHNTLIISEKVGCSSTSRAHTLETEQKTLRAKPTHLIGRITCHGDLHNHNVSLES